MSRNLAPIVALSEADISQLQSSRTITTLKEVVAGLLSNALEAEATNIQITWDHAKGDCIVEDNGIGIALEEFRENGGLLKPYRQLTFASSNKRMTLIDKV